MTISREVEHQPVLGGAEDRLFGDRRIVSQRPERTIRALSARMDFSLLCRAEHGGDPPVLVDALEQANLADVVAGRIRDAVPVLVQGEILEVSPTRIVPSPTLASNASSSVSTSNCMMLPTGSSGACRYGISPRRIPSSVNPFERLECRTDVLEGGPSVAVV